MGELRINISNLSEGTHTYSFKAEPVSLELDEAFRSPITVDVTVEKTTRQLFLKANLTAEGHFTCDRCLEEFDQDLSGSYQVVYVSDDREAELVNEDVQVLAADTNMIELDDDVRQFAQLAIPLKLICKEECLGLCAVCGVNKNLKPCSCTIEEIDPRWDALKKIAKN